MKQQQGFILPSPMILYGAAGALIIILGLSVALKVQSIRLESTKAEYAAFVDKVEFLGEQAKAEKVKQEQEHEKVVKDVSKAWHGSLTSAVNGAVANYRLRHPSSGCCSLSSTPVDPKTLERTGQESMVINPGDGFIQDCAADAAKIESFQTWVKGIGFPVK